LSRALFGSQGALIAYLVAGYPSLPSSLSIAGRVLEAGADAIELGIPFSDPLADGPVIQNASSEALRAGVRIHDVLATSHELAVKYGKPVYIMTYLNPVVRMGYGRFASLARASGVSGVVIPDLPVDHSFEWREIASRHMLETVFLCAPSTSNDRVVEIARASTGFVYLVSVYGVTGQRKRLPSYTFKFVRRVAKFTNKPTALGFGISSPAHMAQALRAGASGVIVGSALLSRIDPHDIVSSEERIVSFVKELKKASTAY